MQVYIYFTFSSSVPPSSPQVLVYHEQRCSSLTYFTVLVLYYVISTISIIFSLSFPSPMDVLTHEAWNVVPLLFIRNFIIILSCKNDFLLFSFTFNDEIIVAPPVGFQAEATKIDKENAAVRRRDQRGLHSTILQSTALRKLSRMTF